jgi:hypothetical protein
MPAIPAPAITAAPNNKVVAILIVSFGLLPWSGVRKSAPQNLEPRAKIRKFPLQSMAWRK